MSNLNSQFENALSESKKLPQKPSNEDLLFMYSHFKQASNGDCTGKRPGMMDMVARAKFDAWKGLEGMTIENAQQQYVDKIEELKK